MAIQKKDYFTFLGGEVSPNLFKRVDMRAASKWFETAKNIFFDTTGGFFNRVGTEVVDNTYSAGHKIRLLKFIYNKAQSYEVVFSQADIKIYDNKTLLATVQHNLQISNDVDVIYTQIGDVMYICLGNTTKIYTLKRYDNDDWRFELFNYNIPPMLDVNTYKKRLITFARNTAYVPELTINITFVTMSSFSNVTVEYQDFEETYHEIYSGAGPFLNKQAFIDAFNTNKTEANDIYAHYVNANTVKFSIPSSLSEDVKSIKITADGIYNKYTANPYVVTDYGTSGQTQGINVPSNAYVSSFMFYVGNAFDVPFQNLDSNTDMELVLDWENNKRYRFQKEYSTFLSMQDFMQDMEYNLPIVPGHPHSFSEYFSYNSNVGRVNLDCTYNISGGKSRLYGTWAKTSGGTDGFIEYYIEENDISVEESRDTSESYGLYYNITCSFDFLSNKNVNDIFSIDSVYSPSPDGTLDDNKTVAVTNQGTGTGYLPSSKGFWSDGSWRLVTSGLMDGTLEAQYSYDEQNWYSFKSFTSAIKTVSGVSSSVLFNEYGTLDVNNNVKLRLKYTLTGSTSMGITFDTNSFENRSYYKILEKTSDTAAIVECIKYPIGTPAQTYEWAEAAWSDTEGYPAICFTYQNRLCFAKTNGNPFVVWTSKTNDYASFDTKIKYEDDDPITMDVVKFNGVSNIATVAALNKLFIFTEDAEYGIQDQGALTQANKSLIAFSKYGAEPLETQVSGNRILFVEHGGKAARQLFYDFAQENYEAPDITVLYKHLLKNEKIIATDYVGLDYRMFLMLTSAGRVICYKYIPEQEITACSWFQHAKGTITNISALDVGNNIVKIYIAVDIAGKKQLEVMDLTNENYLDSRYTFTTESATNTIDVTGHFNNDDIVCYFLNGIKYTAIIANNTLTLVEQLPSGTQIEVGYPYEAEATLIPMSAIARNGSANYTKKNIFKANFEYFDSVAFKVGMKSYQDEFEEIKYEDGDIGTENTPHSGEKDDIIILSSYLDKNMLSFKQSEPYKMNITNLQVEVDYGG